MRILIIRSPYRYNIQPLDLYSTIFAFFCQTLLLSSIVFCWLEQIARQSPSRQVDKLTSCPCLLLSLWSIPSEETLNCWWFWIGQERYCNFRNDYHLPQSNWVVKNAHLWFQGCFLSIFWDPTEFRCLSYSQSGFLATSYFYDLLFLSCL